MRRQIGLMSVGLVLTLVASSVASCQTPQTPSREPARQTIVVYGFSVMEEVMTKELFPAFSAYWQQQANEQVSFQSVFTGSEEISGAIVAGASADVAVLSNEQHAIWLHINDQVRTDWRGLPHKGIVSRSPMIIVVRPGNPLEIKDWADLARPGVKVVHPDPRTSGGAQWALLAEYGSVLLSPSSPEAAQRQLQDIWANVVSSAPSASEALRQFLFGAGDALVTYEQDALLARSRGANIELVIPRSTIISEHVVVTIDRNVRSWEQAVVKAFVTFLWSEAAQQALTRYYFRAVTDDKFNQAMPEFRRVERPFTVSELGGWGQAYHDIVQEAWQQPAAPR